MLANNVKMVIWDLDDTFWKGTLVEGAIEPVDANRDIVIELANRGIISSIVSKNDRTRAQEMLLALGIWEYFVFPKIAFAPKGQTIAALIEEANLRPDNVLFIDDNKLNLEEAKHYCPNLMVVDPTEILDVILTLPQLAGKDDRQLSRLSQYKNLEKKGFDRSLSKVSNEEFLRQCDIRVEIDYDFEKNFDRIVEMANRTNQLNYTKIRLETADAIAQFRGLCSTYGVSAGIVRVTDRYGDYGPVGYFVNRRLTAINELLHFAFSCRIMNMGVEQFIFDYLKKPDVKIASPVSAALDTFAVVDWISMSSGTFTSKSTDVAKRSRLVLLGGCELLQLSSLLSSNSEESVNTVRNDRSVRFDDAGLILNDRASVARERPLADLEYWTAHDCHRFDSAVERSEIVVAALFRATDWNYFETDSGLIVRLEKVRLERVLREKGVWFLKKFRPVRMTIGERFDLVARSLDRIAELAPEDADLFALGVNAKGLREKPGGQAMRAFRAGRLTVDKISASAKLGSQTVFRECFNIFLKAYCSKSGRFHFVDVDSIVGVDDIITPAKAGDQMLADHFTRKAYMAIASDIAHRRRKFIEGSNLVRAEDGRAA